uniref:Uncharacterized protein n=1 Tax=Romanomermis culicivorax TaxID=13658 RepID=A0A915JPT2_ROMCU
MIAKFTHAASSSQNKRTTIPLSFLNTLAKTPVVVLVVAHTIEGGSKDDINCDNLDFKVACSNYDTIEKCGILDQCLKGEHLPFSKDMFENFDKDFNDDEDEEEEDDDEDYKDEL